MPILYAPAAPIGAIISANANRNVGNGGGGGVPLSQQYAEEMNNKQQSNMLNAQLMARDRQGADQLQEEKAQFAARNNFSPRDQGQAQAAMAEQAQRGAIQQQLQQDDFTHADKVHLDTLNMGKANILQQATDGRINPEERDQMLLQLYTGERGINVLDLRKKATEAKYQAEHTKQIQQQTQIALDVEKRKARQSEDDMAYSAAEVGNKLTFIPDIQAATVLRAQIKADVPNMPDDQVEAHVKEQLQAEGKGSTWYPDSKGVPTLAKEVLHGRAKDNAEAGGTSGKGKGAPEFDPSKAYHDAEQAVDKMVAGGWTGDVQAEIEKRVAARQAFHEKYNGEKAQAASAGKAAPFDPADPKSGSVPQRQQVLAFGEKAGEYRDRQDLPPEVRSAAMKDVADAMRLTSKWLAPNGVLDPKTPKYIKDELKKIDDRLKRIPPAGSTQVQMQSGGAIPTQPGGEAAGDLIKRLHDIQAQERAAAAPVAADQPNEKVPRTLAGDVRSAKKSLAAGVLDTADATESGIKRNSAQAGKWAGERAHNAWKYLSGNY